MTPEQIRETKKQLDIDLRNLEHKFNTDRHKIIRKMRSLEIKCPHENQNSCSYSRWCCDCGREL